MSDPQRTGPSTPAAQTVATATSRTTADPSPTDPSRTGPGASDSEVDRPGLGRRWTAGLVTTLLTITLWWALGAPWLPVVAAVTGGLLARLAGRGAAGRVLPIGLHLPVATASVAAMVALAVTESAWVWPLLLAGIVVEVALLRGNAAGGRGRGRGRLRALRAVAGVLAVCGTTGLVVEHIRTDQQRAATWAQTSELNRAQLLPRTPARAARVLLAAVADGDPTVCTTLLTPAASGQLAAVVGAADCPGAVRVLAGRVIDPRRYPAPDSDAIAIVVSNDGQTASADLCRLTWHGLGAVVHGATPAGPAPGPQLGRLDLTRVLEQGYRVERITPC